MISAAYTDLSLLDDAERRALVEEAISIQQARVQLARVDYNEFAEFVLKDEETGKSLQQAWLHEMWTEVRRRHKRALIIAHVEAGKTQQFAVGVPMHELGSNPRARYAVVSRTQGQSLKSTNTTAGYIERSEELRRVYPNLIPGARWSQKFLEVTRPSGIKEPSLAPFGQGGAVSGARLDGAIMDDVLDSTNTRTKMRRDETEEWFWAEIYSRLTEEAFCYFIGNAWHPQDLYHRLEARGWPTYRFPVQVTAELIRDFPLVTVPVAEGGYGLQIGDPTWPERWSKARIEKQRKILPPIEFARSLMCVARDDKDARFKREWIDMALEKGEDLGVCHTMADFLRWDDPDYEDDELAAAQVRMSLDPEENEGVFWVVSGVDLSTGKADDLSAITTIAIDRITKKRFLLDVTAGRWQVDEIILRVKQIHARYGSIFMVENNATQDYIVQILQKTTGIPTVAHTTGRGKADPTTGVEVLAAEMHGEKWIIPSKAGEGASEDIQELITDMLYYSPDPRDHTGDRLMSLWFAQVLATRLDRQASYYEKNSAVTVI